SPNNMVLVASGNFDWERFVSDAEKYCSTWPSFVAERAVSPYPPQVMQRVYTKKNLQQAHLLFITESCHAQEDLRFPLSILATIIGDSSGSHFYWRLVDSGLAESAGADNDEKDGTGCFMAYASTEPEHLENVAGIMREILAEPLSFSEEDLERAKTKLIARLVLGGELPMGRLMALGNEYIFRTRMHSLQSVIQQVRETNRNQICAALEKYPLEKWSEFRLISE
ncbi:MAG: insulinase family protein, partial [Bdellovibrionales bacterium]|nr:insulinase family protein [Bdellovibrionales bacterium]